MTNSRIVILCLVLSFFGGMLGSLGCELGQRLLQYDFPRDSVVARRFVVVDRNNRLRADLAINEAGVPGLHIYDSNHNQVVGLAGNEEGWGLVGSLRGIRSYPEQSSFLLAESKEGIAMRLGAPGGSERKAFAGAGVAIQVGELGNFLMISKGAGTKAGILLGHYDHEDRAYFGLEIDDEDGNILKRIP